MKKIILILAIPTSLMILAFLIYVVSGRCDPEKFLNRAIFMAVIDDEADKVSLLLSRGADVNAQDKYGMSVMFEACYYGHSEIVAQLLKHGADLNLQRFSDMTYLSLAAERGNIDVVEVLLEAGADVNDVVDSGSTALHQR